MGGGQAGPRREAGGEAPRYRALYLETRAALSAAGVEDAGTEAALLCAHFFGLDRAGLALRGEERPGPREERAFREAVAERVGRRPLQYILGEWPFMGLTLAVGEGVLCPREDTAALVEALAGRLAGVPAPKGADLCAGTGAVALGLCGLLPGAKVTCVELSLEAWPYLERNLAAYPGFSVTAWRGDALSRETAERFPQAGLDFLAANPPYIPSGELPDLQPEVRREPALALDGGADGLRFYRALRAHWLDRLKPGGTLAVEIGDGQAPAVTALFRDSGLTDLEVYQDWAGLDRCVLARKG